MSAPEWAHTIGFDEKRARALSTGRARPTLGEHAELGRHLNRQPNTPWLVKYRAEDGSIHGFYTGTGWSYEEMFESGVIDDITEEGEDRYAAMMEVVALVRRQPKTPGVRVWSTNTQRRTLQRR